MKRTLFFLFTLLALTAGAQSVDSLRLSRADGRLLVQMRVSPRLAGVGRTGQVVLVPVLTGRSGQRMQLRPVAVSGRRQYLIDERNGGPALYPDALCLQATQQPVAYLQQVPYEGWMRHARLTVEVDSCGCGESLLDTLRSRASLEWNDVPSFRCPYATPAVQAEPELSYSGRANIQFEVNRTEVKPRVWDKARSSWSDNQPELSKILATVERVRRDTDVVITRVGLQGFASPEGSWQSNELLAMRRAQAVRDYVCAQQALGADVFNVSWTAEDWDGLCQLLETVPLGQLPERAEMLSLCRDRSLSPDERERQLRERWPERYRTLLLAQLYPQLRHTDYTVHYRVRPMSLEATKRLLRERPELLSLNSMWRVAQTYPVGSQAYNEVIAVALRQYPDDPVANTNAAATLINQAGERLRQGEPADDLLRQARELLAKGGSLPEARELLEIVRTLEE